MISDVPTNIITGFLGVGKSTAIMHLLKTKPKNERWAVLVNEFGEVGIDGSLFNGNKNDNDGIFVKEVPGGCMCCTAGLPMQIALNMLLGQSKPDRVLIEPTGLGHPKEVLATLNGNHYKDILNIQKTITLVDARKIKEERYLNSDIFCQQIEVADVIAANKSDLYGPHDLQNLQQYLENTQQYLENTHQQKPKQLYPVSMGQISHEWLEGQTNYFSTQVHQHHKHEDDRSTLIPNADFPETGYISIDNKGEGFFSKGWIFKPSFTFQRSKLYHLFMSLQVERLKAVFITEDGILAFNKADDVLTEMFLDESGDSRIELISSDQALLDTFESKLLACLL